MVYKSVLNKKIQNNVNNIYQPKKYRHKYKHKKAKTKHSSFFFESMSSFCFVALGFIIIIFMCSLNSLENKKEFKNEYITKTENINVIDNKNNTATPNESQNIQPPEQSQTQTQNQTQPQQQNGFIEPIPAFSNHISSNFGDRENPLASGQEFHKGLDIAVASGTEIKAVLDGIVTICDETNQSYGKYIEITHSDTLKTRYAHCSQLLVKNGDTVKQGDVIALVGSTGNSTGPHLHLEVIENGQKVDPLNYLK